MVVAVALIVAIPRLTLIVNALIAATLQMVNITPFVVALLVPLLVILNVKIVVAEAKRDQALQAPNFVMIVTGRVVTNATILVALMSMIPIFLVTHVMGRALFHVILATKAAGSMKVGIVKRAMEITFAIIVTDGALL